MTALLQGRKEFPLLLGALMKHLRNAPLSHIGTLTQIRRVTNTNILL